MEKQTSKEFSLLCSPILATPASLSSEQSENEYVNFDNSTSRKLIAISALFFYLLFCFSTNANLSLNVFQ